MATEKLQFAIALMCFSSPVNSYSVSFNQYDEIEGEFTAYHYTADGTLVSDESGDVTGTLFDFITGR